MCLLPVPRIAKVIQLFVLSVVTVEITAHPLAARGSEDTPERKKLAEQYRLADGENAKLIQPPFTAERHAYHRQSHPGVRNHDEQYGFRYKDGSIKQLWWTSERGTLAWALRVADIEKVDLDGVTDLFDLEVAGDWVVRDGADRKAILADVQRILTEVTNGRIRIEPAKIEKEVIVATGRYAFKPVPNATRESNDVHLYTDVLDVQTGMGGGSGTLPKFLRRVGQVVGQKVIDETDGYKGTISWTNNRSGNEVEDPAQRDVLLKNLTDQTSLQFRIENRKVDVWRVIETTGNAGGL